MSREVKAGSKLQGSLSGTDTIAQLTSQIPQEKSERKCDAEESNLGSGNIKEGQDVTQKR